MQLSLIWMVFRLVQLGKVLHPLWNSRISQRE